MQTTTTNRGLVGKETVASLRTGGRTPNDRLRLRYSYTTWSRIMKKIQPMKVGNSGTDYALLIHK